jgi:hypothetical protein
VIGYRAPRKEATMELDIIREVQENLQHDQDLAGIPRDEQRLMPPGVILSVEKSIEENEETLELLARF